MTRHSFHNTSLPSVSRAGTSTASFPGFVSVTLYSPSPSGLPNINFTIGSTASTLNVAASPTLSAGRPVSAQTIDPFSFDPAGQPPFPNLAQGERYFPPSTV